MSEQQFLNKKCKLIFDDNGKISVKIGFLKSISDTFLDFETVSPTQARELININIVIRVEVLE